MAAAAVCIPTERDCSKLPDIRVVLLGNTDSGKSSSGNTILGREEFDLKRRTAQCVKRQGEVAGRLVTVVEAPGWWRSVNLMCTPQITKDEIVLSSSLCPPGPHVVLLVIHVKMSHTEDWREILEEHVELLGKQAWRHTMVLFTHGDLLGDTSIEQHIEKKGQNLSTLLERCGNRYHVFSNKKMADGEDRNKNDTQVTELLEKIEEMVAANSGRHFEVDSRKLEKAREKRNKDDERAKKRAMKVEEQRKHLQSLKCDVLPPSEFRVVLFGYRQSGKSATGNTILGKDEFEVSNVTASCVVRQGEVAGRQVTVVEAPGYVRQFKDTPEVTKKEMGRSVFLCPPGPHAVLLVISAALSFSAEMFMHMQAHLQLLGEGVWNHTMVVFTNKDWLGDTTIEQVIEGENEGQNLHRSLVEKCGNRYHVLNNRKRSNQAQVTELLDKIEEMVAGNSGRHYELDRKRLEEEQNKKTKEEQRIKERLMKVAGQRKHLQSLKGNTPPLSEFRLVLLGSRVSGKSSSGNTILGKEEFDLQTRTAQCVKRQGEVAGRPVTVVKAPGWWKGDVLSDTPNVIKEQIGLSVSLCPPGPHALLLVIRVGGSVPKNIKTVIQEHMELLGKNVWSHTLVLFTRWDWLGSTTIEQYIESEENGFHQWLVEKCGNMYHIFNNEDRAADQVPQLLEKIEEMVAGNGGRPFEMEDTRLNELQEVKKKGEQNAKERRIKVQEQHKQLHALKCSAPPLSELRIVLLGRRCVQVSAIGNAILGREEFSLKRRAPQCVKAEGEVAGRRVTVVEPPGWCTHADVKDTPELTKQEIVLSASLCPPGPHIFILVIWANGCFTEQRKRIIQGHVELLGERVWSHTMVLFINGAWLGDTTIEEHIESEGEDLKWVVEKCENRYFVLNNHKNAHGSHVTKLLEKIEEMVLEKGGAHYEVDTKRLEEVQEKRREEEERVKERVVKVEEQRQQIKSLADVPTLSEFRIVLLGYNSRSLAGNIILGREEFDPNRNTVQCVKRQGEVAGRQVTIIEAPEWSSNTDLKEIPELTKQEIVLSVSLSPPGPHAFLLVLRAADSVKEETRIIIQNHMELLGGRAWSHTMVLFTQGHLMGNTPIERFIESEGEHLQWVVEKCGNRYHVLDTRDKEDHTQVTQLLERIEEMVAGNGGCHFDMDRKRLEETQDRRKKEKESAKERRIKVEKQRDLLRSLKCKAPPLKEIRLVLLGCRGFGKTSSGNIILGRDAFEQKTYTMRCAKGQAEVSGTQVTVVDTPGWWRGLHVSDAPELTKQEIILSVSLCPPGPHAILLVVRLNGSITEKIRDNIQEHLTLLGEQVWSHVMILFTDRDWLGDTSIEQYIESEGETLCQFIEKCGNKYHVLNNQSRSEDQVTQLLEKIEEMVAGNGGCHFEAAENVLQEAEKKRSHLGARVEERETKVYKQDSTFKFVMGEIQPLSEVRVIFLQYNEKSKSAEGTKSKKDTTLDSDSDTEQAPVECPKRQWTHEGKDVTMAFITMSPIKEVLQRTRRQMVSAMLKVAPGPHVFIAAVCMNLPFAEKWRREIQEHLELVGGSGVWRHTIVAFYSSTGWSPEQYIESEGETLHWLLEKCGNRYVQIVGEKSWTDVLRKAEEVVALNGGCHFEVNKGRAGEARPQDWKLEVQRVAEQMEELELAKSMDTPPQMGGDDRSEITSVTSAYGTHTSETASEAPSEEESVMSAATSSGIGSSVSGPLGAHRKCEEIKSEVEITSPDQEETPEQDC